MTNNVEIKMAKVEQKLEDTSKSVIRIENKLDKFIDSADRKYANRDSFIFWRNLMVSGVLVAIFIGVIGLLLNKLLA